jgi:hypothetical protein
MDPLPLNDQVALNRYMAMLVDLPDRLLARSILMSLIDYEIIYPLVGNGERQRMDRIRDHARQEIEGEDVRSMVLHIMNIVKNTTRVQKIYIFNRVVNLFHDLE